MSTELKTLKDNVATMTRFFRDHQNMVQLTIRNGYHGIGQGTNTTVWFSVTRSQALAMASDLLDFATGTEEDNE